MKRETKEIYLNDEYHCGGFYELAIQVCLSEYIEPIKLYANYIWGLDCIYGPLNKNFDIKPVDNNPNHSNSGILIIDEYEIPFSTINIREENGFNWFDIALYTTVITKVFGEEYITWNWNDKPNVPNQLKIFYKNILKELYNIYPFQLGINGFEVSGENYFENILKTELEKNSFITYYVGKNNYHLLSENNKNIVKKI